MSKALYLSARWGKPVTLAQWRAALRWRIAQETGWTLATIDALSLGDIWEYLSVRDGLDKASTSIARKAGGRY